MNLKNTLTKTLLIACAGLWVSACTPKFYHETKANVSTVKQKIDKGRLDIDKQVKKQPAVEVNDGLFVDSTTIDLKTQPAWLQKKISLHGDKLPFSFYSRNVVRSANALTKYQYGLDPAVSVSMNYTGNIKGALDLLAAKTGYIYEVDGDVVNWKAFVTKTFEIAFMPGSSNYMVGKDKSGSSAAAPGKGGAQVVVNGNSGSSSHQYSSLEGKLSIWTDIEKTVNSMLSPEGKAVVSESTTSLTVHDHPTNVKTIADYIHKVNLDLSRQVMIKVQVLEVTLNKNFSSGINWGLMKTAIRGTKFAFNGDFTKPITIAPLAGLTAAPGLRATAENNGSTALITALSQQGNVSVSTEPTVVTTNNQMASVNITSEKGYIAQMSTTTTSGSDNVTREIVPGQVNTGLTLFLLPKLMDNKVYLQISASLSTLQKIEDLFSTGDENDPKAAVDKIQAPVLTAKDFNQRSVITSGETLILAGYKQLSNEANNSAQFQIDKLGGRGAVQGNTQVIVLITPYVLDHS